MEQLRDINGYVQKMEKSLMDKLFFIDKLYEPVEYIVDFGCANGVLIRALQALFPEYRYIGYDISSDMIRRGKETVPTAAFYDNWQEIRIPFDRALLNISSTVHEVYAYGTEHSIKEFWDNVFHSGFQYIAIRDMMLSDEIKLMADPEDVMKARKLFPEKLAEYESIWGPISIRFNLIHYLLKYRYTENWDREVRENYLPITKETLLSLIPDDYEIVYQEHYLLPYIKQQVQKDAGIVLKDFTHYKLLLKKRDI